MVWFRFLLIAILFLLLFGFCCRLLEIRVSKFTHSICDKCWNKKHPHKPAQRCADLLTEADFSEKCCFCGNMHYSKIYIRENPEVTLCKGKHGLKL